MIEREVIAGDGENNEQEQYRAYETVENTHEDLASPGEFIARHFEVWFGCSVGLVEGDDEREAVLDPVAFEYTAFHFL